MSAPMNMEEWQRRMKAEKEAERKKKTESAEILRGYRGGVNDEELKVRTLREEDRRKTMDAQQNLHNYKGLAAVEQQMQTANLRKTPTNAEANNHPVPVNAGSGSSKDHLAGVDFGSVSERAAALAAAAEAANQIPLPTASYQGGVRASMGGSKLDGGEDQQMETIPSVPGIQDDSIAADSPNIITESESPTTAPIDFSKDEKKESLPVEDSIAVDSDPLPAKEEPLLKEEEDPAISEPAPATTISAEVKSEPETSTLVSDLPPPKDVETPTKKALSETETGISTLATEVDLASNSKDVSQFAESVLPPSNDVKGGAELMSPPTSKSGRRTLNVLFSFGVLTRVEKPELFGYMNAVEKVVRRRLEHDVEGIAFDSKKRPFVKKTEKDPSYVPDSTKKDLTRTLVTAAVPISYTEPATKDSVKKTVVDALKQCIQSGEFLELAQEGV